MKPTQTPGTRDAYARRARQILNRFDLELLAKESQKARPHEVVSHLGRRRQDFASASWRQYKAALIAHAVAQVDDPESMVAASAIQALTWSRKLENSARCQNGTSARKNKSPSDCDIERLCDWLAMRDGHAAAFLTAMILTGLRPIELRQAQLADVEGRNVLVVRNAKATNGRSHGVTRTLRFQTLDFKQMMAIRATIKAFRTADRSGGYDALL